MVFLLMLTGLFSLLGLFSLPGTAQAEPVAGEACYVYGSGETLVAAKHIAISLAKRKALEGYRPYMEATANMRDPQLRNELIANLTVRSMKSIKIVRLEENKAERKVCGAIEAEVEPVQMQEQVSAVFYAFNNRSQFLDTGLPESAQLRIIRIEEFPCTFDKEIQCLNLIAECRINTFGERHPIRIIWYDPAGRPAFTIKRRISCERARDVENILLRLPPGAYTFAVDLP